jgi:hypothetical protein
MNDSIPIGPEDQTIVIDEDNSVLFSDFPAHALAGDRSLLDDREFPGQDIKALADKRAAKEKLHLLDILDGKPADILRMIGAALDRPGQLVEREITFQSKRRRARIMHIETEGERRRTIIVIGPIK